MSVRVVAPCRLHFGLFHVPVDGLTHYPDGRPVRKFGGLGLMIENPCVTVEATVTEQSPTAQRRRLPAAWLGQLQSTSGTLAERALQFLRHIRPTEGRGFGWELSAEGPREHVGYGVGTALGMTMAWILWPEFWRGDRRIIAAHSALTCGRGLRSGIGVAGFEHGGFIVDGGKDYEFEVVVDGQREHLDFPSAWRVVLVRPPTPPVWFGDRERTAFARTRSADRALSLTDRLRSLAYDTVVPAVRTADFDTFAHTVHEFNRLAGEPFHDDQGGPYASPEVTCVIDELMEMGAVGVGQSSWGPTVFAFCRDADEAEHLANRARERFSTATEVTVTAANNTGARLETE